ncbi:unnamed protein product [Acanthoscelides obtectus]|uniref:C2H2-type domain-containing protein n=1 Tax=Acanthoscelides obtectus TaxID=200917 RepID=A0A9P0PWC1_ACAOB|nr:unnamed protein product [Acanthoscelides obtectus]CAK1634028.1 Zinc finger X-chromosomal protein [Acanthoscelides obtectus]
MKKHKNVNNAYLHLKDKLSTCIHCNTTFKTKKGLDHHTIQNHPDFIESVSCKIHQCTYCIYKTTYKSEFARHNMLKHPETVSSCEFSNFRTKSKILTCIHCNATFKHKMSLDDHISKKHPEFISTTSRRIHECTLCSYKTTRKNHLTRHMLRHPETIDNFKFSNCIHCNATFTREEVLKDHIVKKHPEYAASVSSKIYECTYCAYKTIKKCDLFRHMSKHPETIGSKTLNCTHCDATFIRKEILENHIVKKHPEFISTLTSKIHECTHCTFKTIRKSDLARHMLKHSGAPRSVESIPCNLCDATFKSKQWLDQHTVMKHPEFIASVSNKIHECKYCTYKTIRKGQLAKHLLKHLERNEYL